MKDPAKQIGFILSAFILFMYIMVGMSLNGCDSGEMGQGLEQTDGGVYPDLNQGKADGPDTEVVPIFVKGDQGLFPQAQDTADIRVSQWDTTPRVSPIGDQMFFTQALIYGDLRITWHAEDPESENINWKFVSTLSFPDEVGSCIAGLHDNFYGLVTCDRTENTTYASKITRAIRGDLSAHDATILVHKPQAGVYTVILRSERVDAHLNTPHESPYPTVAIMVECGGATVTKLPFEASKDDVENWTAYTITVDANGGCVIN